MKSGQERIFLLDLTYDQLKELLVSWGEPSYRADQLWGWMYRSLAADFEEMTNLPKGLRARLAEETLLQGLKPVAEKVSTEPDAIFRVARAAAGSMRDGLSLLDQIYNPGPLKPIDSRLKVRVGQPAPDFDLPGIHRRRIRLSEFRGRKIVVISFVPAAWTPLSSAHGPATTLPSRYSTNTTRH